MRGVGDLVVCLPLAGYGRVPMVDSDACPSCCDYSGIGVWAVWQADPDTTWQELGALPRVAWGQHGQLGVFPSLLMQVCGWRPGQDPPEAVAWRDWCISLGIQELANAGKQARSLRHEEPSQPKCRQGSVYRDLLGPSGAGTSCDFNSRLYRTASGTALTPINIYYL